MSTEDAGLFATTLKAAGGFAWPPRLVAASGRNGPDIPYGIATGDVTRDRAIIWSRTDRPARMLVEWSTTESMQNARRVRGPADGGGGGVHRPRRSRPACRRDNGFSIACSSKISPTRAVSAFPPAERFYPRRQPRATSRFAWSADTVGQGWGINTAWGGLRMYETMRLARPDFFIHTGDTIYADSPVPPEIPLPDGTIWRERRHG